MISDNSDYIVKEPIKEFEYSVFYNGDKIFNNQDLVKRLITEIRIYSYIDIASYGFNAKHVSLDRRYIKFITYISIDNTKIFPIGNLKIIGTDGTEDSFDKIVFVMVKEKD